MMDESPSTETPAVWQRGGKIRAIKMLLFYVI
jgi:hypothetical protein